MRVVLQRVSHASVAVDDKIIGKIDAGLVVLCAYQDGDELDDISWICNKIIQMRIFSDKEGKMNLSLMDLNLSLLVISQFTLFASTKKGNRPSFIGSAPGDLAKQLYEKTLETFERQIGKDHVACGRFGADMQVSLCNDGPVTIWLDSKNKE